MRKKYVEFSIHYCIGDLRKCYCSCMIFNGFGRAEMCYKARFVLKNLYVPMSSEKHRCHCVTYVHCVFCS